MNYFFFLRKLEPARPSKFVPKRSMVAGSGIGALLSNKKVRLNVIIFTHYYVNVQFRNKIVLTRFYIFLEKCILRGYEEQG